MHTQRFVFFFFFLQTQHLIPQGEHAYLHKPIKVWVLNLCQIIQVKTSHLWLIINLVSCLLKLSYLSDNVGYLKTDLIKNRFVAVDMSCDVSWILKIRWGGQSTRNKQSEATYLQVLYQLFQLTSFHRLVFELTTCLNKNSAAAQSSGMDWKN